MGVCHQKSNKEGAGSMGGKGLCFLFSLSCLKFSLRNPKEVCLEVESTYWKGLELCFARSKGGLWL